MRNLEAEQHKLYELIWRRTLASQMKSAEIERTTADIAVDIPGRRIELRAVGSVVTFPRLPRPLRRRGQGGSTTRTTRIRRELPAARRRRHAELEEPIDRAALHPAAAALHRSQPDQEDGRARHRPPSTYAATLSTLKSTATMCGSKSARWCPRIAAASSPPSSKASSAATSNTASPPRLEEQLDQISAGELDYKQVLREFWTDFSAHIAEIKDLRVSEVLDALNELLADHIFPPQGRRQRSAQMLPDLRHRPAVAQARQVRRLHRLLELSRMQAHHAALRCRHRQLRSGGRRRKVLGTDPETGEEVHLKSGRFGPYVQLGEGKEPKRSSLPKGWEAASLTLERPWQAAVAAARGGPASGDRPRSSRPASAATAPSSCMTANMPTCPMSRRCSRSASTAPSI
jgi:DNA topoisomerase-1